MGFLTAIGTFISSVTATVSSVASSLASGLSSAISTMISRGPEIVARVAQVIGNVLQVLGVIRPDDDMEALGDRALQASERGITPDQFSRYDDYMAAIRNVELDPKISANTSSEAKLAVAIGVGLTGLENKLNLKEGTSSDLLRLVVLSPDYFDSDRLQTMLDKKVDFVRVVEYFSGNLDLSESRAMRSELFSIEQTRQPDLSEQRHASELNELKHRANDQGI